MDAPPLTTQDKREQLLDLVGDDFATVEMRALAVLAMFDARSSALELRGWWPTGTSTSSGGGDGGGLTLLRGGEPRRGLELG